jgi:hypothetical protein
MASDARSRVGREKSLNMVVWTLVNGIRPCGFYTLAKSQETGKWDKDLAPAPTPNCWRFQVSTPNARSGMSYGIQIEVLWEVLYWAWYVRIPLCSILSEYIFPGMPRSGRCLLYSFISLTTFFLPSPTVVCSISQSLRVFFIVLLYQFGSSARNSSRPAPRT